MTPADRRLADLIARWLTSIDLHLKYAELDDAKYWELQAWPRHERPSKWVLEVARQKLLELKALCDARRGDDKFVEALESMAFLANLVGLQHIQRFIPLATASESTAVTVEAPAIKGTSTAKAAPARTDEATREMPRLKVSASKAASTAPKAGKSDGKKSHATTSAKSGPVPVAMTPALQTKIVADAVRLLKWGKQWHELAELIARIAERPPAGEIRKVLRNHKADIDGKVARAR